MSVDRSDRCPQCGTPYMSVLAPGAVDDRVCHTCNNVACAQENIYFDSLDDLAIVPHENEGAQYKAPRGNQRKIMERQIRSSGKRAGTTSNPQLPVAPPKTNVPSVRAPEVPSVGTSEGTMSFYFCEKCGKRVTNHDLATGQAHDKPMTDVYCVDCAPPNSKGLPKLASGTHAAVPALKPGSNPSMPAAKKSGSNPSMPAVKPGSNSSMPAAKPAGHSTRTLPAIRSGGSTRLGIQPAAPAQDGEVGELSLNQPAPSSAPYSRSSARNRAISKSKNSPVMLIASVVGLLVVGYVLYAVMGSKPKTTPTDEPVATAPTERKSEPTKPVETPAATAPSTKPKEPAPEVSKAETKKPDPAPVVNVEPAAVAPAVTEVAPVAPAVEPRKNSVEDLFAKPTTKGRLDDGEDEVAVAAKKQATKEAAKDPAAPKKPAGALEGMGITGVSSKKPAPDQEPVPEFDDIRKPKPVIPVTATQPTIVVEDLTKGDQNPEKDFSRNFQQYLPGWRVRDINVEMSMYTQAEHRGKKDVLILNPMNDQLPAKLYCTMEIPKEYSGKRPMLAFEVSTTDKGSDWLLSVKCMNLEIRPKSAVRVGDDVKWMPVVVDLSPLAGKRFDLSIEAYMTPKANKKSWSKEKAYIRNVQLMWTGKK